MANIETLKADQFNFAEVAAPSTPASGQMVVYGKTDGRLYSKSDGGQEYALASGHEFDYVEKTSQTSVTATTEATANTIVTGSAVTYDGATVVVIEFFAPYLQMAVADNFRLWLYDGSSSIGQLCVFTNNATATIRVPVTVSRRLTPSAAAHTYSIRGSVGSGTGVVDAGAGGTATSFPAYIRITKA
jgi:hypothetical protein